MKISILLLALLLQGCANQAFFVPKQARNLNPDIIFLPSDSGNQIATLLLPTKTIPRGTILHFHGNSGHMEQTREKVDWLVDYGFDVWLFDYSGFGHSSGTATDIAAVQDSIYMLNKLMALRESSSLPVYAIATSTGANLLIRAMADEQAHLDGIIIDSGFTSYRKVAHHVLSNYPMGGLYSWVAHIIMRDDMAAGNDTNKLTQTPALVMHCLEDTVVPISFGREIFKALPGEKHLLELAGCRHARGMTREHPKNQQQVLSWLEQDNKSLTVGLLPSSM